MVEVIWTDMAIEDIRAIAEYIARDSMVYATAQVDRIFRRVEILQDYPYPGKEIPEWSDPALRELNAGNYRIIYEVVTAEKVCILMVVHGARRADYFKSNR